ncbi:hypothetical protein [Methanotorris formicicus]|uniref:Uncharacterized protein n=1 Tax=Methanotorris formicicus Mc-S-70 TaxID=647171 RepID=H1L0P4_9EURY|nr:hypothetical protein [Methanotorris formicicus]EHP84588.1 hypothetical protein MetfoDRAFT_1618 [Methanotorris formicicus Mc-S-70]
MLKKLFVGVFLAIFLCMVLGILSIIISLMIHDDLLQFLIGQITWILYPTALLAGFLIANINNKQLKTLFKFDIAFVIGSILILLYNRNSHHKFKYLFN